VQLSEQKLNEIKSHLCELPSKRRIRYVKDYGLSDYDAGVLSEERATADFFEETVKCHGDAKRICNLITQTGLKIANEKGCKVSELGISPIKLAVLAQMVEQGLISATASVTVFEKMTQSKSTPQQIAESLNLLQKSDAGELEGIIDEVLKNNQQAVEDFKAGGKKSGKARGFLLGQVMQKTKGTANPKVAGEILDRKLRQ
jgi:aspartyl-tRNA(Asn)/glutamyl-tRNA(Gln) amidotransferase subunit B